MVYGANKFGLSGKHFCPRLHMILRIISDS